MKRILICVWLTMVIAVPVGARVTSFEVSEVDNSSGGVELAGYTTNDVKIDFTGQYTGRRRVSS